jgi:hypothetical protein
MEADDILEVLAARHALAFTPQPWFDAARGVISIQEAARRVADQEDPELVQRSSLLFAPGDAAVDEQRLQRLLDRGFGPRRLAWRGPVTLVLLLAAMLVLVVLGWERGVDREPVPLLASYTLELDQVASSKRAARPEPPSDVGSSYYMDRSFRATLRPWTEVTTEVEAVVYACEADGARRLPVVPRVTPSGVVIMESDVAGLDLGIGAWELLFVVGAVGSLPQAPTCAADELDASGVQALRTRIEILPPPP